MLKKKALYKQELHWMRQGAKARSTKQQARIQRFNTLEEDLSNRKTQGEASLNLAHSRLGKQVFELDDISKSVGDRKLFEHFTTIIQKAIELVLLEKTVQVKQHYSILLVG